MIEHGNGARRPRRRWRRRLFLFLVLVGIAAAVLWAFRGPGVPRAAVLVVDLRQGVPERAEEGLSSFLGGGEVDLLELRRALVAAEADPRIRGLVLRAGAGALDLAQAEEVRALVDDFRRRGKFAIGFSEGADGAGYLAISSADEVVMSPANDLYLVGVSLRAVFLGDALRRLGVDFDLVRVGEFKGAYEQLTQKEPSPEFQRANDDLADSLYGALVEDIASARKLQAALVRSAIDEGPLSPARAVEAKLADRVAHRDELEEAIAGRSAGVKPEPISVADYLAAIGRPAGAALVAVVHVRGLIAESSGPSLPLLGPVTGADEVGVALRAAREDPSVRAVVLRIDSPGGTIAGAESIWRELEVTRKTKPVVASMGGTAASGGYYIACAADRVIARPATLTGSIGIFGGKLVLKGLLEQRGVGVDVAARGRRAGMFDLTRPFTDDQRVALERTVQEGYRLFLDRVSVGRKRPLPEVERIARGRVWTGSQAREQGLVDVLGGLGEAVAAARQLAHITESEEVELRPFPPAKSLLELLSRKPPAPLAAAAAPAAIPRELLEAAAVLLDGRRPLALAPVRLMVR